MSIPKKGSRKITVADQDYRWSIRKKPTYAQAISEGPDFTAAVELYNSPGATLVVSFHFSRPDSWISPNNESVTPSDIERAILKAINQGWKPAKKGKTFHLNFE